MVTIRRRMTDMDGTPNEDEGTLPPELNFLRRLVTVLTATMILGVLVIIVLLVIRLWGDTAFRLPEQIVLPEGATISAFTKGDGWYAVVTGDQQILIYDAKSGELRQSVHVGE